MEERYFGASFYGEKREMQLTPAMQQYMDVKQKYADCILFFRIGDFYEVFFEDAHICHKILDLVMTSKNKNSENPIPMAGIPHHSIDKYIPKLIQHGYKVAIAEQKSEPIPGRIVERDVTSIITPGTYIQETKKGFTYMLALHERDQKDGKIYHIAWGDFSIGEYWTKSFDDIALLQKFVISLQPSEIILETGFGKKDAIITPIQQYIKCLVSVYAVPVDPELFIKTMCNVQSLASFGQALEGGKLFAAALLFDYIRHTQHQNLKNISKISLHAQEGCVLLDEITIKNLELFSSSYEANEKYSLYGILDNTKTAGGSRLLRYLLSNPSNNLMELERRLKQISYYTSFSRVKELHHQLGDISDTPKTISSLLYRKLHPLPFFKLRATLSALIDEQKLGEKNLILGEIERLGCEEKIVEDNKTVLELLKKALKNDGENGWEMDFVRDGYDGEIDRLRKIAYHSDELLMDYQQELVKATGITNVKIKYIMNQGYFVEVTSKDIEPLDLALETLGKKEQTEEEKRKYGLIRRQTLKGNQRYLSPYLDEVQTEIIQSKDQLVKREFQVLEELKTEIEKKSGSLNQFAEMVAWLDLFSAHAIFANEKRYTCPHIVRDGKLNITGGRHPVIEAFLPRDQQFIPNDLAIGKGDEREDLGMVHIITGPNMGGKSTYLRQSALIVLMAHCGLFVPAEKAEIGVIDGLFARVGSGDVIAKNQSTFMTEMIEVSNILHNATSQSFIIFDELGRGTSTYDGLALTSAILQYIIQKAQAKTLIATHYHELIKLEKMFTEVQNFSVSVYETDKEVVFMKKIVKGGANKSYGIDVAKLAGIPESVLRQAREILSGFEKEKSDGKMNVMTTPLFEMNREDPLYQEKYEKIKRIISQADVNNMTPLQAIQFLAKIKEELD